MNGTADRDAAVLGMLRTTSATRPQIAVATQMSKPTVSAAIAHLERLGLVHSDGQATGATGRKPTVYALNRTARLVVGIDIGGVNTRLAIADRLAPTDRLAAERQQLLLDRVEETLQLIEGRGLSSRAGRRQGFVATFPAPV